MHKSLKLPAAALAVAVALSPLAASAYETGRSDAFYEFTGSIAGVEAVETAADASSLSYDAASVILGYAGTGEVLFEDSADEQRPIASITKVMTMLLVMEALEAGSISLDDVVTTSEHAYSMGGSQIWLEPGETMTVDELLRAVAVGSANDAAVALAEHVSGSEAVFVARMNERTRELGMTNTVFKNSNGLDEDGHLSSARDVFIMSRELLKHPLIREYVTIWMDELRGGETQLVNTNKLLNSYNGITGLKTGTTGKAGVCVSASAEREGMELIAVVLGSPDSASRFKAASALLDFGFANYEVAKLSVPEEALTEVAVRLGKERSCAYCYSLPERIVVQRGLKDSVVCEATIAADATAPVEEGQILGEITEYVNSEVYGTYPVTAAETVEKLDFATALRRLLGTLCSLTCQNPDILDTAFYFGYYK